MARINKGALVRAEKDERPLPYLYKRWSRSKYGPRADTPKSERVTVAGQVFRASVRSDIPQFGYSARFTLR